MAVSKPPVVLPKNKWVDLYAATGITVGTKINAHNPFDEPIYLTEASSEPNQIASNPLERTVGVFTLKNAEDRVLQSGAVGAWAISFQDTSMQVEES